MKKRLVSGIKPSGAMHIGNYLGAIKQWLEYQYDYESFLFVADYHALTSRPDPNELKKNTFDLIAVLLACGVDPKRANFFLQSSVPAHTELSWILSNFTSTGQLNRMTQFKEKSNKVGQNAGLYTYPILMSADVLLYQAEVVPVGDDQVQHLELTREIARSLNQAIGSTVVEPKPLITKASRIMALNDPSKKMSKSEVNSGIGLLDSEAQITQTIKRAVTETDPNNQQMSPGVANLFTILQGFSEPEQYQTMLERYQNGTLRFSELKELLTEAVLSTLLPIQKTFNQLRPDEEQLLKAMAPGAKVASSTAAETLSQIKTKIGLL